MLKRSVIFFFLFFCFSITSFAAGGAKPDFYILGSRAYITNDNTIMCVDIASKTLIWSFTPKLHLRLPDGLSDLSTSFIGKYLATKDTIFLSTNEGYLILLKNVTGEVIRESKLEMFITTNILKDNNILYFGGSGKSVYAYNIKKDTVIWSYKAEDNITNSLLIGEYLYFGSWDMNFYALNLKTGEKEWIEKTYGAILSNPLLLGDRMYFGCNEGTVCQMNPGNGGIFWKSYHQKKYGEEINPVVVGGNLMFKNSDSVIVAVDIKRLEGVFGFPGNKIQANSIVSKDSLLYYYGNGILHCVDPLKGYMYWDSDLGEVNISSPVITDNFYYYKTRDKFNRVNLETHRHEKIFDIPLKEEILPVKAEKIIMKEVYGNITYPPKALDEGITGKVIISILLDENGNNIGQYVSYSDNKILLDGVLLAIGKSKFTKEMNPKPGKKCWINVSIDYKLS
jgi:outer membrane protein assembly factor BamB